MNTLVDYIADKKCLAISGKQTFDVYKSIRCIGIEPWLEAVCLLDTRSSMYRL